MQLTKNLRQAIGALIGAMIAYLAWTAFA